ncbi:hypothetical protein IIC68_01980, partial [archaeon]|nr:hypothetical protein [archaeon]
MIGDYLIEVNVTSPTCLQEMNRLYNCQLEIKVIEFTEQLIEKLRSKRKLSCYKKLENFIYSPLFK